MKTTPKMRNITITEEAEGKRYIGECDWLAERDASPPLALAALLEVSGLIVGGALSKSKEDLEHHCDRAREYIEFEAEEAFKTKTPH